MSLSRIAVIVIGAVLAFVGLMLVVSSPTTIMPNLVVGLILIVVGVFLLSGRPITI